jgi:HAD superfamily 5'-nucleotidase-like hydrolase
MSSSVFCNRTLNMKRINYIGLDMDHTLVRYNSANFEGLAHRIMREKLVQKKNYPKSILKLPFEFNRAIRGLVIDKVKGNILKLSRHTAIRLSYHGTEQIDYLRQNRIYKSTYIDIKDKNFDKVDTTFSISFATLFAQLVDMKEGDEKTRLPDFITIASDLNFVLDEAHRDGSLKDVVRENLNDYILKDAETVEGLERYIKHNKKFFIATNSDFQYAKLLLDHTINPYLKGSRTWQDIFSFTIVRAHKPNFFFEDTEFLRVDPITGESSAFNGALTPGVYEKGNANRFTTELGLEPDEILYIGDHIYGDIVRLKKDCAWRTALVVEELDREVRSLRRAQPYIKQINALMDKKIPLESQIDDQISRRIETGQNKAEKKINDMIKKSMEIDKKISPLIKKQQALFNPHWGEIMRVGIEESYFAYQVERFACIYTARLSYLLDVSPRTYFRSMKRALPHEIV